MKKKKEKNELLHPSEHNIIIVDATNKSLGRLASQVAVLLQRKTDASFTPQRDNIQKVKVENLRKIVFKGNKMNTKIYYKHSGYIGHLKETKLKELWEKNPLLVFKKAVAGMLPKNKLRNKRLKRLEINI